MHNRIAIVPARGGSKRIPNKNIKDFCGKPIISYILKTAHESNLFNKIHVSTECDKITKIVSELGFPPDFIRPDYLSDDITPLMPVLKYVLNKYIDKGEISDQVWLLYPCSPLIKKHNLIEASLLFESKNCLIPIMSICEFSVPIEWAYEKNKKKELKAIYPGKFAIRSQDLEKRYFDTGNFSIFPPDHVLKSLGSGSNSSIIGFELNKTSSIDIDDLDDWAIAEAIYSKEFL